MPSGRFITGIILIVLSIALIGLPFIGAFSFDSQPTTINYGAIDSDMGYRLLINRPGPIIKVDVAMTNLDNDVSVRLVAYESEESDGVAVGNEATSTGNQVDLSWMELGFEATPLGLKGVNYYVQVVGGGTNMDLSGVRITYKVTPLITVLIGPIILIIGILLLFLGRGGASPQKGRGRARVSYGYDDEAPEPVLGARVKKAGKKKKKKKKMARPRAEAVGKPPTKPRRCPQCGANVPAGQMYCPSCYSKV